MFYVWSKKSYKSLDFKVYIYDIFNRLNANDSGISTSIEGDSQTLKRDIMLDSANNRESIAKEIEELEKKIKRGRKIMRINKRILLPLFIVLGMIMMMLMLCGIKNVIVIALFFGLLGFLEISSLFIDLSRWERELEQKKDLLSLM